ncbi:MAG: pyruvate kinase [gamma proteobacterium symbiont of Bathyaustriella thionipta]|nr:pyruvate kinase [gamma proteobacterium symbiont of Bathyaustriella thionipta]MCU7950529.1 pyruvate kinase [gamma proteobacterium symbiont of Bathyaustriella thionipta]MCU7954165.1 pyruvate kinase [gamma proteobacterium symbiont of Bathyaustriella thionipta]MCU7957017.1 pyruvate kinase [gamma proteobacterium symbiont of Bathyaustriella thionipta]MCU7968455.1 pyruvate kinase [gamma proteobacterium symbiont of Bathyaustriella thionipta]
MRYPANKTKIVCTIGPATESSEMMEALLRAGMNVARLNFSHGDFSSHGDIIKKLRAASEKTGQRLAIMADLPGPKMRIGELKEEPIELQNGAVFTLTTENIMGDQHRVSVSFKELPTTVKEGDKLFLNDGLISLLVTKVDANDVCCEIRSGGELRSRKGLNLPGIDLGFSAFTAHDRDCLEFALKQGVDAVSQSFVANKEDIIDLKKAAKEMGFKPFVIAKIERSGALDNLDNILQVSDGIMVARGDLGVEIPISSIAVAQKRIMKLAGNLSKPVITATQMLESMTEHRRPTRAEATDVANAILDGTDAVMLSGESAMGRYPVDATSMLAEIASSTEPHRSIDRDLERLGDKKTAETLIAHNIQASVRNTDPEAVITPTRSGNMARNVARYRLPVWVTAFSSEESTCQALQFSYGVFPVKAENDLAEWTPFLRQWFKEQQVEEGFAIIAQGPSPEHPLTNHRMGFIDLSL